MNKVLFFAHLRDAVGEESVSLTLAGQTVAEAKALIAAKFGLNLEAAMTAINEEFALDAELIAEGDVIAFIPPVSGG